MNPCMPLWEHIADGEPHVFKNPIIGEERLYIYGTHDTSKTFYGSLDYTLWSAPINNLTDWKNHGVIWQVEQNGGKKEEESHLAALFAPDCCQGPDGKFYLFAFPIGEVSDKRNILVSDSPEGPFQPYGRIEYLGDPAVFVDEDSRVYVYNGGPGFKTPTVSRLDKDMLTTLETREMKTMGGNNIPNFFEASSLRKVGEKYIYIYSSARKMDKHYFTQTAQGLMNGYALLEYCYSDNPMGPWKYGGVLMNNGGEPLGEPGEYYYGTRRSYYNGTIHGSIEKIAGKWYVFYHKNTNNSDFCRQTCMEPIQVKVLENGEVCIAEAEMTSQGCEMDGLPINRKYPAGIACYLTNGAYITSGYEEKKEYNPITNIKNGVVVGIKYMNFGEGKTYRLEMELMPRNLGGRVAVRLDNPKMEPLVILDIPMKQEMFWKNGDEEWEFQKIEINVGCINGKHAIYFSFYAENENEICEWNSFKFTEN